MSRMNETVQDRAERGAALAAQVERRDAALELGTLLRDEDTFVILRTATALLERRDAVGLRLLVKADMVNDPDINDTIGDAVADFRADALGAHDDFLRDGLQALASDPDADLASAAASLLAWSGLRH